MCRKKFVKLGDENTSFFHARADERYRFNAIKQIIASDGRTVSDHFEKTALFYQEFRNRLGVSTTTEMIFDWGQLMESHDLQVLILPFSVQDSM
jgi:hypothetical protein